MKPCDQTCPKCGAFPVNLQFYRAISEAEAADSRVLMRVIGALSCGAASFEYADKPREASIACNCPRCSHRWTVKPMDAEVTNDP